MNISFKGRMDVVLEVARRWHWRTFETRAVCVLDEITYGFKFSTGASVVCEMLFIDPCSHFLITIIIADYGHLRGNIVDVCNFVELG